MKTSEAVEYYGSQSALADALGISQASIAQWGDTVPPLRQVQLQMQTEGALQAQKDVFDQLSIRYRKHAGSK